MCDMASITGVPPSSFHARWAVFELRLPVKHLGRLSTRGSIFPPLTEMIYHGTVRLYHGKTWIWYRFCSATFPFSAPQATPAPQAASAPSPTAPVGIKRVDVVAKLEGKGREGLAAAHNEKLNWKTSIVDLMKLLSLDSSLIARKNWRLNWGVQLIKWAIRRR